MRSSGVTRELARRLRAVRRVAVPALLLVALVGGLLPDPAVRAAGSPVDRSSLDLRATYTVTVGLSWAANTIRVATRIGITNTSGGPISRLELNTVAARLGSMTGLSASVGGTAVTARISGQTLIVPLPHVLAAGGSLTVRVSYRARFRTDTAGSDWLWSDSSGVIAAYRFIPWVSRAVAFDRPTTGDPFVTPVSPRVQVTFTLDRPLTLATSGRRIASSRLRQTFLAENVRDFNFTASPDYKVLNGTSVDGSIAIRVLTRWGGAGQMLAEARRAIAQYEAWIGPYPYPTFTIAQTPGGYGMELPALIWIPRTTTALGYVVAHETAHQWFYAVVGNDQTTNEFADEAMAELLSRTLTASFRASRCSTERLDLSIYQYSGACYYEVVYIQGAAFLRKIRSIAGDAAFWGALRRYYAANRYGISTDRRLLTALLGAAGNSVLPMYHDRFPSLF